MSTPKRVVYAEWAYLVAVARDHTIPF